MAQASTLMSDLLSRRAPHPQGSTQAGDSDCRSGTNSTKTEISCCPEHRIFSYRRMCWSLLKINYLHRFPPSEWRYNQQRRGGDACRFPKWAGNIHECRQGQQTEVSRPRSWREPARPGDSRQQAVHAGKMDQEGTQARIRNLALRGQGGLDDQHSIHRR
jgi:hypothetical protein